MIEKVKRIINKRIVISIFLSLFVFQLISGIFVSRYSNTDMNIRIEATGEKNLKSKGSGIQIKSILVNDTKKFHQWIFLMKQVGCKGRMDILLGLAIRL